MWTLLLADQGELRRVGVEVVNQAFRDEVFGAVPGGGGFQRSDGAGGGLLDFDAVARVADGAEHEFDDRSDLKRTAP